MDMKQRALHKAQQLFNLDLKTNQDGLAEALLIAEYGRRIKL